MVKLESLLGSGERALEEGHYERALELAREAFAESPTSGRALLLCSLALQRLGRVTEAVALVESQAHALPTAAGYIELARLAADERDVSGRDAALARALERHPLRSDVHRALGDAAEDEGQLGRALEHFERALELDPRDALAEHKRALLFVAIGRADEAMSTLVRACRMRPLDETPWRALLMTSHYVEGSPRADLALHRRWSQRFGQVVTCVERRAFEPPKGRKIRIGYVSPDLRDHAVIRFLEGVLRAHDRDRFEVFAYSTATSPHDAVTERIRRLDLRFVDATRVAPRPLAERIARDRIDVLVDVGGHTEGSGLASFTYRPAPLQLTWLGYPDTTGLDSIDLRVTDAIADPEGAERFHTERLLRLSSGAWCYGGVEIPVAECTSRAELRFGSFNALAKLSPATIATWARVLERVPNSVLMLSARRAPKDFLASWVAERFAGTGVDPSRIRFRSWQPDRHDHLHAYDEIDLALDPFPYNGTTTTCDALWMGVPVVALAGERHVSRVGASLLHRVGLDELVASDVNDYVRCAVELANDHDRRARYRRELRERFRASTLGNATEFTRELERVIEREVEAAWRVQRGLGSARRVVTVEGELYAPAQLDHPLDWTLVEHGGADESERSMLGALAARGSALELGAGSGVLSLTMARGSERLWSVSALPDATRLQRLHRALESAGLSKRAQLEPVLPDPTRLQTWLSKGPACTLVRVEPIAPPDQLFPWIVHALDAAARAASARRAVVAVRVAFPPFAQALLELLGSRGYRAFRFEPSLGVLAPLEALPTAVSAHAYAVHESTLRELVELGVVVEPDARAPTFDDVELDALYRQRPFVERLGLAALPVPHSVRCYELASRADLPMSARLTALRLARREASDELRRSPSLVRTLTWARMLWETGSVAEASELLGPFTELDAEALDRPEEAFLPVHARYERPPAQVAWGPWLEGQVKSAFVHTAAPAGCFQPDDVLALLARIETLGMSCEDDDRRTGLVLARKRTHASGAPSRSTR